MITSRWPPRVVADHLCTLLVGSRMLCSRSFSKCAPTRNAIGLSSVRRACATMRALHAYFSDGGQWLVAAVPTKKLAFNETLGGLVLEKVEGCFGYQQDDELIVTVRQLVETGAE